MKKSTVFFVLVALAAVLALSACGNNNNNVNSPSPSATVPPSASAPAASSPAVAGGETKAVTISAINWEFNPSEIRAKVGDTLKLTLQNTQGAHGIEISDLGVKLKNGETQEIRLDKAGTYEFHCFIQCGQGHDNMTGFIVVE